MKKILLFILLTVFGLRSTSAQEGFGFGGKIGLNASNLHYSSNKTSLDLKSQVGLTGGVFVDYVFRNGIAISVDALYAKQGLEWEGTEMIGSETQNHKMDIDLHYLNVPVMFGYYPVEGLAVKVGVQPGFALKDNTEYTIETYRNNELINTEVEDYNDIYKKFDLSIPIGISYLFPFGLMIDARYNFGLTNINGYFDDTKLRNNYFSFTAGYRF